MGCSNYITKNLVLPLSDFITGQSVTSYLNFLLKSQYWTREQIDEYQNQRLRLLIKHSYETVPYYRDLFISLGLSDKDIQKKEDLSKLPLLTKAIIKREGIDRFSSTLYSKKQTLQRSSSGSTGEPLFYLTTKEAYSVNIAANLRGWHWMGFQLGDRYVKLSQNPRKNPIKRLQDRYSNNLYLATNPLVDENYSIILTQIERFRPKIIRCYPDPLLFIARHKKMYNSFSFSPQAITTTGNTLFPEVRNEIEDAFGCKIFDSYSCEGNSNVFECPTHTCYHSAEEYGISEVLNDDGQLIKDGVGRLISTDLWNFAHPFIRYDTQDLIELDSSPCECGRNLLKIKKIIGRDNDVITVPSGRKFIVHNFTGFFQTDIPELKKSVNHFQVIKNNQFIRFKIIVNSNYSPSVAVYIKDFWQSEMDFPVEVEVVDEIPLTISGKRKFIIQETLKF
jgi:phenylacetate-CoA ligase